MSDDDKILKYKMIPPPTMGEMHNKQQKVDGTKREAITTTTAKQTMTDTAAVAITLIPVIHFTLRYSAVRID